MASYWQACCIVLLYWTAIIQGASVKSSSSAKHHSIEKGTGAIKTLSLISIPPIPEFPKLNTRPNNVLPSIVQPPSLESHHQVSQTQTFFPNGLPNSQTDVSETSVTGGIQDSDQVILEVLHTAPVVSTQPENQHKGNGSADEYESKPISSPEKIQQGSYGGGHDFPQIDMMPPQVLHILNALGSGGSLAQASKPEKDGAGHSTANAIGYATGDNATVMAKVTNQMAVQPLVVTITDSAEASASSSSNGTAFSQATLSSNGWTGQQWGSGWNFA
ncbi:unnamed protein product [Orchesella dallaii]|uniref:Uncharacterized protein n=1 Tax=Orchesella dallaii TaxID=48710 RepID=A0ABP1Q9T0_9HEXA